MANGAAAGDARRRDTFLRERKSILDSVLATCGIVAFIVIVTSVAVAGSETKGAGLAGFALIVAATALSVGGLLGFLFAVPRDAATRARAADAPDRQGDKKDNAGSPSPALASGFAWNSNLVEVSDWLTKIIVGVGLTQLENVPSGLARLSTWFSKAFAPLLPAANAGDLAGHAAVCISIFYLCMGFVIGHLMTQLWLFRAYTLARRDTESDLMGSDQVLIEAGVPPPLAKGAPVPPGTDPTPTEAVKDAAKAVLQQSHTDLRTTPQIASYGVALALNDQPQDAATYLRMATAQDPTNLRYLMALGRALIAARRFKDAIEPLERAVELAGRRGDTAAQTTAVLDVMLAGLYTADIATLDKVIRYGQQYGGSLTGTDRALANRYLAAAYGQKYSANKRNALPDTDGEQVRLRGLALGAVKADLDARIGPDRESERTYLRSLMEPAQNSEENDLADFKGDAEFRNILGAPP